MSTPRQDDTERDAWLSEALRHAPDAQAAPSSALSDAILRQARAATNAAHTPAKAPARSPWAATWDWLARPPVAAGFASVMVATLVGLMWWDQPMDPTLARPPAADASPAPAAAPPPVAAAPQQPAPSLGEIAQGAAKTGAQPAAQRKLAAPKPAPRPVEAEPARSVVPARAPAVAPEREGPAPFADRRTAADAVAAAPAPAPAPATPPPVPAAVAAPAPALALRARESAAPATAESKLEAARDESRALTTSGALARGASAKAAAPAAQRSDNFTDARPVAFNTVLASVAAQPERWGWERSGAVQPMRPALQRWLARLDAATSAARWGATADAASSGDASVLRLYRDGALAATLRLDDETVGLAPGPRATLPPATLAALKQALDDASR